VPKVSDTSEVREMTEHSTDILIVGGGPGGIMSGMTAAQISPDKRITLARPETKVLVPCGIPYILGTLGGTDAVLIDAGSRPNVDLASFQLGSQPMLTASIHPIVGAAVNALANHFQNARPAMGRKEGQ
jgi:hypothetical protein